VYRLNARTGAVIWRFPGFLGPPAVANGILYTGDFTKGAYAVNARTGALIWHANSSLELDGSTPAVAHGLVYFGINNCTSDCGVVAYDAATGQERWRFHSGAQFDSVNGGMAEVDNTLYADSLDRPVYALDATTGEERWRTIVGGVGSAAAPASIRGVVFAAGIRPAVFTGTVSALDASSGGLLWQYNEPDGGYFCALAATDGMVFGGSISGSLYGFALPSG
jgi:outer membrane protein assembly factor BamB